MSSSRKMAQALVAQKKLAAKRKQAQTRYPGAFTALTNAAAANAATPQVPKRAKRHKRHYS